MLSLYFLMFLHGAVSAVVTLTPYLSSQWSSLLFVTSMLQSSPPPASLYPYLLSICQLLPLSVLLLHCFSHTLLCYDLYCCVFIPVCMCPCPGQSRMTVHGSVAGCVVVVVCLMALLAERSEGHITFFSPKEMMLMKVTLCV